MKIKVVIRKGEDGYYIAECPMLKGCVSQGKTPKEALDNIKEAIELWLETYNEIVKPGNKNEDVVEVVI
ncbi:type II toxin-antitoxin system HicB family antitoxin [Candidatus Pyrohabitans sp.]